MSDQLTISKHKNETKEQAFARAALTPEHLSAAVLLGCNTYGQASIIDLSNELKHQTAAINSGDMTRAENMLVAQAHTLDALFADLARRAFAANHLDKTDKLFRLALKAQGQCRATLQTLGELKAPKQIAFVKQANIGNNVQVNNGTTEQPARTGNQKAKTEQTELLEVEHGERLDTRAQSAPSVINTHSTTVVKKHRPTQRRRQSGVE